MGWNCVTSKGLWPVRLATVTIGLACAATSVEAHPVTLHMAFISEADDGLTRQNVDALGHTQEAAHKPTPSPEHAVAASPEPSSDGHRVAVHHHRHHRHHLAAGHDAVAATTAPVPHRPWLMLKIIAFTHWWNGWSEKNLHTKVLNMHLDRPANADKKTA